MRYLRQKESNFRKILLYGHKYLYYVPQFLYQQPRQETQQRLFEVELIEVVFRRKKNHIYKKHG